MYFESADFDFERADTTVVIAEAGVNHNGDPQLARSLIDAAKECGADIVKFQAFRAEKEISRYAPKVQYQISTTGAESNQLEMCRALELDAHTLRTLRDHAKSVSMPFLCSAFDFDSVDVLADSLKLSAIKISSSEVTNLPLLEYIGAKKMGAILSTGGSTLAEVGCAIDALRRGGCRDLILLHCVSSYPAPVAQANLRAMNTLRQAFGLPAGFSDHTPGINAAITAAALGACALEKHFTLDRTMVGPDHAASVEPDELRALAAGVAAANQALGNAEKKPAPCEMEGLPLIRKSLVAAHDLAAGMRIERSMVEIKRPAGGIEPAALSRLLGKTLVRDLAADRPFVWSDLV